MGFFLMQKLLFRHKRILPYVRLRTVYGTFVIVEKGLECARRRLTTDDSSFTNKLTYFIVGHDVSVLEI